MRKTYVFLASAFLFLNSCSQSETDVEPEKALDVKLSVAKLNRATSSLNTLKVSTKLYNSSTECVPNSGGWYVKHIYNDCFVLETYDIYCNSEGALSSCDSPNPERFLINIEAGPKYSGGGTGGGPDDEDSEGGG